MHIPQTTTDALTLELFDPALEAALRRGIAQKPVRHHLQEHPSDTPRTMNQIGG